MYLGKYPDTPGALPPGYHGTAYTPVPEEDDPCPPSCECDVCESEPIDCEPCDNSPCQPEVPCECTVCDGERAGARGLFEHIFSHKLDMEDLLLLALVVMMISSGADTDVIIMLALLFVFGL